MNQLLPIFSLRLILGMMPLLLSLSVPCLGDEPPAVAVPGPDVQIPVPAGLTVAEVETAVRTSMLEHHWVLGDAPAGWLTAKYVRPYASLELRISCNAQQVEVFVSEWAPGGRPLAEQKRWLRNVRSEIPACLHRVRFFKK